MKRRITPSIPFISVSALFKKNFTDWLMHSAREHGVTLSDQKLMELLAPDIELNTQGVEVWQSRMEKQ